ncbi:MAG: hypothetical protein Q9184_007064 [Pyrenodesmia sp. 2 TL-2023]
MNTRLSGGPAQADLRKLWLEKSPMGIGDPEDLTGAVILLCSEAGRFITGTDIKLDALSNPKSAKLYLLCPLGPASLTFQLLSRMIVPGRHFIRDQFATPEDYTFRETTWLTPVVCLDVLE